MLNDIKTPEQFLKYWRKNQHILDLYRPHEDEKFGIFCRLIIQGRIELGEITTEDIEETHRFWECLKKNNYRRMPNKEEYKKIIKESSRAMFLN